MESDLLVLGFDTSAAHCAAALLSGDRVLGLEHQEMAKGQAEQLFPLLERLLAEAGLGWGDLSAIGVGIGPGNFTGIRISVASARGLALSLGIPAVGVSMLESLAAGSKGPVLACLDARRNGVFVQPFDDGIPTGEAALVDLDSDLSAYARHELRCVGTAATMLALRLEVAVAEPAYPPAEGIARTASERWRQTTSRPAPLYLRPADAAPSRDSVPVRLS